MTLQTTAREESTPFLQPVDISSVRGELTPGFFDIPDEGLNRRLKALLWDLLAEELPLGNWQITLLEDRVFLRTLRETYLDESEGEDLFSLMSTFVSCGGIRKVAENRYDIFASRRRDITPELRESLRGHIISVLEYIDTASRGILVDAIKWKNCRVELIEGPQDAGFDVYTSGGRFFIGFKSGTLWINHGSITLGKREISTSALIKASWKENLTKELSKGLAATMEEMLKELPAWIPAYRELLDIISVSFFDIEITPRSIRGKKEDYVWEMKMVEQPFDAENADSRHRLYSKFVDNQGREAWDEAAFKHLQAMLQRFDQEKKAGE